MRVNRLIGLQVAGRFTIKRFLGEGGMATVFVAEQDREPREVALKIMNEDLNADRSFVKRFQREAKAAARVQHPNSVAFIDYGVANGLSYIAMELLQGDDLYVLLERDGAITQGRAVRIVVEVCDALMVAHELGIVHRDLKPENIMVIADLTHPNGERVKVLDFGIAKMLAPDVAPRVDPNRDPPSGETRAGTLIGTPAYMSPEQCALLPVDTRADIYTCGVLLFQLVTGRLPFQGETPLHTATLHIHEPAPRPSQIAPAIDPRLEAVILKALAKKPTERHQTARHLAVTLRKLLPDLPDVKVAKVGKPAPGSLRPSTRGRNSVLPETPRPAAGDSGMESAKTMVALQGAAGLPPSVVLRDDESPSSDAITDSAPPPIRPATMGAAAPKPPAAGRPYSPHDPPQPADLGSIRDSDSDDSMRTLVRAPLEDDGVPRFSGQGTGARHTEVIPPSVRATALAAALGPPPAPPPPAPPPTAPLPTVPRRAPPRAVKPTLKSAMEFAPAATQPLLEPPAQGMAMGGAPIAEDPDEPEGETLANVTVAAVLAIGGPSALGSVQLGSAQLTTGKPGSVAEPSTGTLRPGITLRDPSAAPAPLNPAVFAASANKANAPEPTPFVRSGDLSGVAQTVPLISPSVVASVIARGPGAAQAPPRGMAGAPQGPGLAALPQTPPVYPLEPVDDEPAAISGTRGLLIGFVAGALLMGLVAAVYLLFLR